MLNFTEVLGRIKDIISSEVGSKKVYDKDVAQILGIHHLTLATMKTRGKIPYEQILSFCAKRKISVNWLLFDQIVDSLQEQTDKFIRVRYLKDIYASAGGGAQNYEEEASFINIDEQTLECMRISDTKNIEAINVLGDSMEPTLYDGNIVFIDRQKDSINKGGIFVVSTPAGLFIKRLQIKTDGTLDLISDNANYSAENVRLDDVRILGQVVGAVSEVD